MEVVCRGCWSHLGIHYLPQFFPRPQQGCSLFHKTRDELLDVYGVPSGRYYPLVRDDWNLTVDISWRNGPCDRSNGLSPLGWLCGSFLHTYLCYCYRYWIIHVHDRGHGYDSILYGHDYHVKHPDGGRTGNIYSKKNRPHLAVPSKNTVNNQDIVIKSPKLSP